ncbi:MAG: 5-dehydro-4-deoxyglucarate dehydratase [Casimicrobiaceae bacterium]
MSPQELKERIGQGLLSFPVTDFRRDFSFDEASYRRRLEWLQQFGAAGLFAAGGTGEFFSLAPDEYGEVVGAAVEVCRDKTPIIAGTGCGTRTAIQCAEEAERRGASGLLILPHYLTEASQDGLIAHVGAICQAVSIGVIVYNRGVCRLNVESLSALADRHSNLIGFKDGIGDIELMMSIYHRVGDRLAYLGGLPTAEIFAPAYFAMGVGTYSSAAFNFIPRTAMKFHRAVRDGDAATVHELLQRFFLPLVALRNRKPGYAVSVIKAGVRLVGRDAGPVRTPLTELDRDEIAVLESLIQAVGGE